ncbi:2-C-methyl-D-erythritol 4-phosphate cytidylyltransferase [uncultured Roseobacter sp.]|uniref:2-C-methyl-D-erythritol 4-phosphate cytidylyltransferase n=1 Tax=uncultured Roseobacter sp. TaxID=114847 RepID=UPI00261E9634|nr:2-C-methyl-D-erythritol 4-phosphate cytidylyltransferase [uncultured Roseobacter sp.]
MTTAAIIVAAGRGTRAGGGVPKQWRALLDQPVAAHAVQAFVDHPGIGPVVLVIHPEDWKIAATAMGPDVETVTGGDTRSASVNAGLAAVAGRCDRVLIHDAARPCVSKGTIDGVLAALETEGAAAPALAVVDALWTGADGFVTGTTDRTGLFRAQTPQGFDLKLILEAHTRFPQGADDDVGLARRAGHRVAITAGDEDNLKITLPEDFERAGHILRARNGHQTG